MLSIEEKPLVRAAFLLCKKVHFALLFVLNGVFYNLKTPQGMLVIAAGLYKETRIQSTIQAAILLVGGVVLGFKFGLIGVMAASCLSNLYRCIDLLFFIPKTVTHLSLGPTFKNMIEMLFMVAAIAIVSHFIFSTWPGSLLTWLLYGACNLVLGLAIVLGFHAVFEHKSFHIIVDRLNSLLGR